MKYDKKELISILEKRVSELNYVKPGKVPGIDLYMDQVTTFMDEQLNGSKRHPDDKILTKTMINNYTKNDLLPPPVKKKYSKEHIYILTYIYYFKNLLSISDIKKLLGPLNEIFFDSNVDISMDEIYKEVYSTEKLQLENLMSAMNTDIDLAGKSFENVKDDDDRNFLKLFSLISLLSFDVYIKKSIIEEIIDDVMPTLVADDKPTKKEKK